MSIDLDLAMHGATWTAEECAYLRTHLRRCADAVDIGIALRRSADAVIRKARRIGAMPRSMQRHLPAGARQRIRETYAQTGSAPIAAEFGLTIKQVSSAAHQMGLKRINRSYRMAFTRDMGTVARVAKMLSKREPNRRYSAWSYGNIGRRVGMTRSAISGIARDLKDGRLAVAVSP